MGKPKASNRKAHEGSTKELDSKSRAIDKANERKTRERNEKSYRESEATDSEEDIISKAEVEPESPLDSGSDFKADSDSSGSEYGKKKKKASPVKGKRPGKRPASSSPKKGGRGRGRALKAPSKSSRNGKKKGRGDSSEGESSMSDSDDRAYPPPAKVAKKKPKAAISPKRGRAAKKVAESDEEASAPPRRGGRQRAETKYRFDDSDEDTDPNDRIIPGASAAKKPATGTGVRGRKPAAGKAKQPSTKIAKSDDDEFASASDGETKASTSKKGATKVANSDEESDFEETSESKPLARKAAVTARAKNAESDDDDDYDRPAPKKASRAGRKPALKKLAKGHSDSEESDEVLAKKAPARKPTASATVTLKATGESDSDELDLDDGTASAKKAGAFDDIKSKITKKGSGSDSESSGGDFDNKKSVEKKGSNSNSTDKKIDVQQKSNNGNGTEDDDKADVSPEPEAKSKGSTASAPLKNRTDTDYSSIDFSCEKKTVSGEDWNLKIACWNIGGVKSWVSKNGLEYLKKENPDVMCLQEVKCNEKTAPSDTKTIEGYPHSFWNYSTVPGQSGVAIFSKTQPKEVSYGIPINETDKDEDKKLKETFNKEGRLIVAEFEKFILFNAYVPNSGRAIPDASRGGKPYPPKIINAERIGWDRVFREYVKLKDSVKPVIVTGDLNVSHEPIDLANPNTNSSTAGYTKEEREGMTQLLEDAHLIDSFRTLYPTQTGAYTYWTYMHNARAKNTGWRLDYFLLSEKLKSSLCENVIRSQVFGSDHCPIVLFAHI